MNLSYVDKYAFLYYNINVLYKNKNLIKYLLRRDGYANIDLRRVK